MGKGEEAWTRSKLKQQKKGTWRESAGEKAGQFRCSEMPKSPKCMLRIDPEWQEPH